MEVVHLHQHPNFAVLLDQSFHHRDKVFVILLRKLVAELDYQHPSLRLLVQLDRHFLLLGKWGESILRLRDKRAAILVPLTAEAGEIYDQKQLWEHVSNVLPQLDTLETCPHDASTLFASQDVPMRVHFLAEDLQLPHRRRLRDCKRLLETEGETRGGLHLVAANAWVQTQHLHAFGVVVVAQDGEVRDDAVRARAGRQAGCFTVPGPSGNPALSENPTCRQNAAGRGG